MKKRTGSNSVVSHLTTHVFKTIITLCEKHGVTTIAEVIKKSQLSRISISRELEYLKFRELISISSDEIAQITLNEFDGADPGDEGAIQDSSAAGVETLRDALGEVATAVRVVDDSEAWRGIEPGEFLLCNLQGDAVGVFRRLA